MRWVPGCKTVGLAGVAGGRVALQATELLGSLDGISGDTDRDVRLTQHLTPALKEEGALCI